MDDKLYLQKQVAWQKEFEALCLRCGECCGLREDPCSNLIKAQDGKYACAIYDKRLGAQRTVSGKIFTCVPIQEVLKKGMPNKSCGYLMPAVAVFTAITLLAGTVFPLEMIGREEMSYKKFKLEKATCEAAVFYKETSKGMDIGVSAIATGKGADFRKWRVTDIKIHAGDERIRPDQSDNFYVKEKSLWRVPAAILFAAIGTQINVSGTGLEQGIAKAGAAIGLGLLVLAAQGEITGNKCIFRLDNATADKVFSQDGFAEIRLEDADQHWQDTIKIGMIRPEFKADDTGEYKKMSPEELLKLIDDLGGRVDGLEKEQAALKYGVDPKYDRLQAEIEDLQTQRGIAYKIWFEKTEGKR
ncbi:MAG: hypothetical protein PHS46_04905 [Candidatus Omnitrophica bacterium]|nr:hypothetical protein [Candidatus Omnitrophota bacterium]